MIWALAAAVVLGAVWRRWWGDERPAWAYRGYRLAQAVIGIAALALLALGAGHPWWGALIRALMAIGLLASAAQCVPIIWKAWDEADRRFGLPRLGRMFDGWTTYAEATAGALIWALALTLGLTL